MVDHGLEFNDKLPIEFIDEILDDDFFNQFSKTTALKYTFFEKRDQKLEGPYDKEEIVKFLKKVIQSKDWTKEC